MDRLNARLTLEAVRAEARDRGARLSRATIYRNAQNMLARNADEARAAGFPEAEISGLGMAARYCGSRCGGMAPPEARALWGEAV